MPLSSPFTLRRRAAGLRTGLAGVLLQALAGDAHPFLFVGVGRAQGANVRSHVATLAFARAADHQVGLFVDRNLNAFGNLELDGMRLAEREGNDFTFELRAVSDAHDVQILLEALRDAVHRVGDERTGQPMQRAMLFGGALGNEHAVFLLETDAEGHTHGELAFGALHFYVPVLQRDFHALRNRNWFIADTRHRYQTSHKSSPPILALRAARPLITPVGVVRMLMPKPPTTGRISMEPTYARAPGREMRFTPLITLRRSAVYFRKTRSILRVLFSSTSLKVEM